MIMDQWTLLAYDSSLAACLLLIDDYVIVESRFKAAFIVEVSHDKKDCNDNTLFHWTWVNKTNSIGIYVFSDTASY